MHINVFAHAFGFAVLVSLALDECILASLVMFLDFSIVEYLIASELLVYASELQTFQFLHDLLLYGHELRFLALHGTGASLATEFVQTCFVEMVFAFYASHCVHENRLTQGTQHLFFHLILVHHLLRIHRKTHALLVFCHPHKGLLRLLAKHSFTFHFIH